jgi:bacillithiol system protein YtxJ
MKIFRTTTHLSEIIEHSEKEPVIIFKYSNNCGSSDRLSDQLEVNIKKRKINFPVYKITVQKEPVLSKKISEWFEIKHETPQIFILYNGKITYTAHHKEIDTNKLT